MKMTLGREGQAADIAALIMLCIVLPKRKSFHIIVSALLFSNLYYTHALYELGFICVHIIIIIVINIHGECFGKTSRCIMLRERDECVCESPCWVLTAAEGRAMARMACYPLEGSIISTFN